MKIIIVLLCICKIVFCVASFKRVRRFEGGQDATTSKQFPYIVSLRWIQDDSHFCGGSIIDDTYILTAAHCLETKTRKDFYVAVGTTFIDSWRAKYFVKRFVFHPDYDFYSLVNDIAIIKLSTAIKFSRFVQKIPVAVSEVPDGASLTICGWGTVKEDNDVGPTILQHSNVTAISQEKCQKLLENEYDHMVTEKHICTYDENIGFCYGDSGSPLAYKGEQVGIVSWNLHCGGKSKPDVYVKVSSYTTWMEYAKAKLDKIIMYHLPSVNFRN